MTVEHIGRSTRTAQHFDGVTQRFRFRTAAKSSSSSSSFVGLLPPFVSGFDSDGDGRDRGRSYGWLRSGICISGGRPSSLSPSLEESMLVLEVMTKMGSAPSRHLDQSDEWAQPMPILQGVRDFIYEYLDRFETGMDDINYRLKEK